MMNVTEMINNLSDEEIASSAGSTGSRNPPAVRESSKRGGNRFSSSMKKLFHKLSSRSSSSQPSSQEEEEQMNEQHPVESRRSSMEREESLRLVDVTPDPVGGESSKKGEETCNKSANKSAESSTSALTGDGKIGTAEVNNLHPEALAANTLHNSSGLFSPDVLDAIAKDAKGGTNSISKFDASTSAEADGPFQVKNLFFATAEGARAAAMAKQPRQSSMKLRSSVGSASSESSFSNNNKNKKRRVNFHGSIRCRPHITINQFSPEEFYATWRTEEDKYAAQQETLATARRIKKLYAAWFSSDNNAGNLAEYLPVEEQPWYIDTEEETSRGIEHLRAKAHTQARRDQKRYIVDAVPYEQFVQRRSGMADSCELAMTSYEISEACRNWANHKAMGDAIHGEKRRESLLNKYAGAAKRMSKLDANLLAGLERLVEEDEESDEEGLGSQRKLRGGEDNDDDNGSNGKQDRRRSSAISFEKHDALIAEELNALVDDENDLNGNESNGQAASQSNNDQETSVISKFETCTLDQEVASGRLQMHQNAGVNAFIGQLNRDTETLSSSKSTASSDRSSLASRQRRTSFQFLHTSTGANAAAAHAAALAAACLEEDSEEK